MRPVSFHRLTALACALAAVLFTSRAQAQTYHGVELVHADLLADTTAIAPGKPFTVGLRLKMQPHWHTYWQYSGDAGLPTKIDWQLPAGYQAGPIQWPVPETITSPGDIINYGYDDEVVLLTEITPPATLGSGEVTLAGKAKWLVCESICVPGSADLSLKLSIGDAQAANADVFQKYRARLPRTLGADAPFTVDRAVEGDGLVLRLPGLKAKEGQTVSFFPLPPDDVEIGHPAVDADASLDGDKWFKVRIPMQGGTTGAAKIGGVVAVSGGGMTIGWTVPPVDKIGAAAPAKPARAVAATSPPTATNVAAVPPPAGSLGYFLLLGFLGGLILNVMPCVLPVISLKLFSFVKQANESPARVLRLGLAYAAGVFAWFLSFAVLIIVAKKAGGQQIGYSFQLQNPWFLLGLIAVTFVFALNLLGVFEVILPGAVTNAAGEASSGEGYSGAFLQGVLATVLGSACTAPVFAPALAFALSQSGPVIVTMFAAIAAGMSAPFVLLAAFPRWLRFLPKPGGWMERVKQGMGFLMLATVLWLLWNFGENRQSTDAVVWTVALMLALGVACWVQGVFNTLVSSVRSRWLSRAAIALLVLGGGSFCVQQIVQAKPALSAGNAPFAAQLSDAQKTGRPVFVDFTASWCVNCKVNERVVLSTDAVQRALKDRQAVFLKADYTAYSEDIARLLRQFNAPSVPLYVIYPAGKPDEPVVLPTLLTQQIVLDGLSEADHRAANAAGKPVAAR